MSVNSKNRESNEKINQANIDWQREALGINQSNSLSAWNLQNEYNTPQAQMKRFKEAGLNPNLIYGQGTPGNASSIEVAKLGTPELRPNHYTAEGSVVGGIGSALSTGIQAYTNLTMNKAQAENVRANTMVARASAASKVMDTAHTGQQMKLANDLWDTTVEKARADMQNVEEDVNRKSTENVLLSKLMRANVPFDKAVTELANAKAQSANTEAEGDRIRANIDNLKRTGKLQDLEIEMRKAGMSYSDPLWSRVLMRVVGGENINKVIDSVRSLASSLNPF